jgi:HTH-type transcriptional regulator / antitoxin HigA
MLTTDKDKYLELFYKFPPRMIRSEEDFEATQAVVNNLLDKPSLSAEEREYLNVLGALIYEYEETLEPIPDIYGVELLKFLLEEHNLRQKDIVPIFKTESIVSEILNGKRELTVRHIQELAEFFRISPEMFFPVRKG